MTTFEQLITPLHNFLSTQGRKIDEISDSRNFLFKEFVLKMIYSFVMRLPSMRMLLSDLKTNPVAAQLGLSPTAYSTFRDAFSRFDFSYFKKLYLEVLQNNDWASVRELKNLGIFQLVDGSLFPTLKSMEWAKYKKKRKSIRLHLSWALHRQIPTEFIGQKANSSERRFLLSILQKGITYIADRGYFSFEVGKKIHQAKAFFIIRLKSNLKYKVVEELAITTTSNQMPTCFDQIRDGKIQFDNDPSKLTYRLIRFRVLQSVFLICTNRMDLTTLQVILLYAYRWQIELFFKFIKRTLNGIHLFNNSENGVNIQFYLLMTTALLQLRLKQICLKKKKGNQSSKSTDEKKIQKEGQLEDLNTYDGKSPEKWIKSIAEIFYTCWKIDAHWLLHLKNLITQPFENQVINILATE